MAREEMGLRCLLRVALEGRSGAAPVPIALVAAEEGLSSVYAAKLMRQLRMAGLVESIRGAAGGYRLTRDAGEITVWDAIQALDESFLPAATCDCDPEDRVDCRRTTGCAVSSLWRRIGDQIHDELASITLAELCAGSLDRSEPVALPVLPSSRGRARPKPVDVNQEDRLHEDLTHGAMERTTAWPFSN